MGATSLRLGPASFPVTQRRVDLQTHSTCSDGTLTPRQLVQRASEKDLAALALTDHDTVAGLEAFQDAGREHGVETVFGIELSTRVNRHDVDVLGYFIDPESPALAEVIETAQAYRHERAPRMLERLEELGVPVEMDQVEVHAGEAAVGRPHVAQALVEAGHVDTVDEAFAEYIGEGQPGYVAKERLDPPAAIEAIHAAGGVAVFAHPSHVHPAAFGRVLEHLVEAGIDGIEVWHSDHDPTHEAFFSQQAERLGLVRTGGSDFHGDNKPGIELGEGRGRLSVGYKVLEELRARVHGGPS